MNLIAKAHGALQLGVLLLGHHLFHQPDDFQRGWGDGEVFLRCQRCGLRQPGCADRTAAAGAPPACPQSAAAAADLGLVTPQRVRTAGYLVWHLSTKWRVAVDRALNRFGMTHAHYLVLGSLAEFSRGGGKPSQRELADFAGLEVMYVSKLVRSLEESGLVRRADHAADTRAFQLELTARGVD